MKRERDLGATRVMTRACALALTGGFVAAASLPARADGGSITVYAAGSLREAFGALGPAFTSKTGVGVALNFAGSDLLATQIRNGAPADVFASANVTQMRLVTAAGLASGPPVLFARNRIVLITPKANPGHVDRLLDLSRRGTKVVLAEVSEPVGTYAREAFKNMAGHGYPADFAQAVERNVISNEMNEKAVATKIALAEGDAGVVYSTDVIPEIASRVNVLPFPPNVTPDIEYPIAVLKSAQNAAGAQAFIAYVLGEGQRFLAARGFLAV